MLTLMGGQRGEVLATSGWRGRGAAATPICLAKQRAFNSSCLQGTKIEKQIDCVKQMLTHLQPKKYEKNTPNPHIPAVTPISSSQTHVAAAESVQWAGAGGGVSKMPS